MLGQDQPEADDEERTKDDDAEDDADDNGNVQKQDQDEEGSAQVEYTKGSDGGTQMRVIRHYETNYVGNKPVKRSSNVEVRDQDSEQVEEEDDGKRRKTTSRSTRTEGGRTITETVTKVTTTKGRQESTPDSREAAMEMSTSSELHFPEAVEPRGRGKKVVVTETRTEKTQDGQEDSDSGANGGLRSIMKQPGNNGDKTAYGKKEISFSEDVVGG